MTVFVAEALRGVVRCPTCVGELVLDSAAASCPTCRVDYTGHGDAPSTNIDLRPQQPVRVLIPFTAGSVGPDLDRHNTSILAPNPAPAVDFTGVAATRHVGPALRSWIPPAPTPGALALDLGCGTLPHRQIIERAGYTYVGVDYRNPAAPFLADAHCLPFADDSFDFVFTIAVFEHLRNPLRAMQEIARVLKPGGRLLGTVAFQEPYHDRSYFNHSALGVMEIMEGSGLTIDFVSALGDYSALDSIPKALFPKLPQPLRKLLASPLVITPALWWAALRMRNPDYFTHERLALNVTGTFAFAGNVPA